MRGTADINKPIDEHVGGPREHDVPAAAQSSTRDQTDVLDFGIAPSYKFGIGTPTEVTLYALLQHNHDQVDYGLPPLNGYPAHVARNTAYGFDDDRTDADVIMLGATIEHKFNKDLTLRNQTPVQLRQHQRARDRAAVRRHARAPTASSRRSPVGIPDCR